MSEYEDLNSIVESMTQMAETITILKKQRDELVIALKLSREYVAANCRAIAPAMGAGNPIIPDLLIIDKAIANAEGGV